MTRTRLLLGLTTLGAGIGLTSLLLLPSHSLEPTTSTPTTLDPGVVWMMTGGQQGTPPPTATPLTLDQLLSGGVK